MCIHEQGYEPEEFWYWASTDGDDNVDDEDYEVNKFTSACRNYCCLFLSLKIHLSPSMTTYVQPTITASGVE